MNRIVARTLMVVGAVPGLLLVPLAFDAPIMLVGILLPVTLGAVLVVAGWRRAWNGVDPTLVTLGAGVAGAWFWVLMFGYGPIVLAWAAPPGLLILGARGVVPRADREVLPPLPGAP